MKDKINQVKQVYNLQIRKTKNAISAFFNGALTFTGAMFIIGSAMAFPVAAPLFGGLLGGIGILIGGKGVINLRENYKTCKALQDAKKTKTPDTPDNISDNNNIKNTIWVEPPVVAKGNSNNNKIISVDEFIENGPPVRKR